MTQRFAGRSAIVTGASRGIGRAVAIQLASEGADVAIVARSVEPGPKISGSLNETAERVRGLGSKCVVIGSDLSDSDDRARIVPEAIKGLGHVDILVNNAAAAIYQSPATYSLKHRRLSMEVNYQAPADLMQALVPHLAEAGEGWVVNVTSSAANPVVGPPFELKRRDRPLRSDQGRAEPAHQRHGRLSVRQRHPCKRSHAQGCRLERRG